MADRTVTCTIEAISLSTSETRVYPTEVITIPEVISLDSSTAAIQPSWATTTEAITVTANSASLAFSSFITESMTWSESTQAVFPITLVDTFIATDSVEVIQIGHITETVTALGDTAGMTVGQQLSDTFLAKDSYDISFTHVITEVIDVTNTMTDDRTALETSTFTITDTVTSAVGTTNLLVSDTFTATDSISKFSGLTLSVTETIDVSGTVSGTETTGTLITETATFEDTIAAAWQIATVSIAETAIWVDTPIFGGSTFNNLETSTFIAKDSMWSKDLSAIAWVMNTESRGLWNYENFGFDSIAEYNGVLYATSPDGISELTADDDDGRDIAAHWKTGFEDFGADNKKRMSGIYVSHNGGEIECSVETYDSRDEHVYTYLIEERLTDAPRNNRIRVGKGLTSRYWRFTFNNVNGADFQVQDVAAEIGISNRRL
jgi:hypothetical protein